MEDVLNQLVQALERGEAVIYAAVIRTAGSAPRTSGARMLVLADGSLFGSVGGGGLERACQLKAAELLESGPGFAELDFNLNADIAAEAGMVCGGKATVLLQRLDAEAKDLFRCIQNDYRQGLSPVLLTILPNGSRPPRTMRFEVGGVDEIPPHLLAEIQRHNRRTPFLLGEKGGLEVFVEPLVQPGTVHLVGAGHVSLATARCAAFAGFDIAVMDDRTEFADSSRFPGAKDIQILDSYQDCLGNLGVDDYLVIATRGHLHDREVLAQALRTQAGYIGMIGSKRKREAVFNSLLAEGFTSADLERVSCPVGLSIGADTPEEIAISIVAELVKVRSGLKG